MGEHQGGRSMSAVRWTEAQSRALATRGRHLLVSAAAGSGKTAVLVERIVRRITEEGGDIDRLLVVTFTEAAAAQMRERIVQAIEARLAEKPGDSHLSRQLLLLPRAHIATLHSFCLNVVRQHFYSLGLDPNVRVMDEHEAHLLRLDVLAEVLEEAYDAMEPGGPFARLVDAYGGRAGDETLQKLVLALHDYARSLPDPNGWLREAAAAYTSLDAATFDATPWAQELLLHAQVTIDRALHMLRRALALAHGPGGASAHADTLSGDVERLEQLKDAAARSWSTLVAAAELAQFPRLKTAKKDDGDPDVKEATREWRNKARTLIHDLYEQLLSRPLDEQLAALTQSAPVAQELVELVMRLDERYTTAKGAKALIDFGDIEHLCLRLLEDASVAQQVRDRFDEVLVDECQDLNGVQDAILSKVTRPADEGGELFLVGDVKQSIYRFRQADPTLFLERYQRALPDEEALEQRIDLRENFRSRRIVVDAVNFLFRQIMTPGAGEMAYGSEAELVFGASFGPPDEPVDSRDVPVEVHVLDRAVGDDDDDGPDVALPPGAFGRAREATDDRDVTGMDRDDLDGGAPDADDVDVAALEGMTAFQREALLVASRIRQLVQGGEAVVWDRDAGRYRPARYGDIVILLRAVRHRANELVDILAEYDVPAYADLGTGYFAATEIETMMALLSVLDNPRQDIELAAVLRSPIVGCSTEELARVRLCHRDGDFYDAVLAAAEEDELGALRDKVADFLSFLDEARTLARRMPLSRLVWHLLNETGYYDYAGAMPGGRQRQANLRALHERARQFDTFARHGLARFLQFVTQLRQAEGDLGTAPAVGESDDVVRIMSVHTSKGLQFPIVFVVDCGRQLRDRPVHSDIAFQRQLGIGLRLVDTELRLSEPSLLHAAVTVRRRREDLAEEMRLLYVAMTRAQERLIIVGSASFKDNVPNWIPHVAENDWPLPDAQLLAAKSWLDWLGPALMRHPDGDALRAAVDANSDVPMLTGDTSRWNVRLWTARDVAALLAEGKAARSAPVAWQAVASLQPLRDVMTDEAAASLLEGVGEIEPIRRELVRRLQWRYPWAAFVGRPAKQGVSELKRRWEPGDEHEKEPVVKPLLELDERPAFLQQEAKLTPTERGAAVHLVMQHLDLSGPLGEDDIARQIGAMVERDMLTPEQAAEVNIAPLLRFFESPLGVRLRQNAQRVRREVPFTMALPAVEAYPDLPDNAAPDDIVVVQGVIDCLLRDGNKLVIVDYKTDRVSANAVPVRAQSYYVQVALYRRAVREMFNVDEVEAYLVFLTPGVVVPVPEES